MTAFLFAQIEREKLETEEVSGRLREERDRLDRSTVSIEQDNNELQKQVQNMQHAMAEMEHGHAKK